MRRMIVISVGRGTLRWIGILAVALIATAAATVISAQHDQDAHGHQGHDHGDEPMDMAAMMAAVEAAGTPGEHHAHMAKLAGNWDASIQMWMSPDGPPMESTGSATNEMILDGRFLQMNYVSEFDGKPFHGMGIDGYDNMLKKHVGSWIDNVGTMIMSYSGECSEDGKFLETLTKHLDPTTGKMTRTKSKTTVVDDDRYLFEMWSPGADGKYQKSMRIEYRRKS